LRRMTVHRLERCAIGVRVLCERAEVLLRDALQGRELLLDGDPELVIRCDADQATQVLVNLLANAVEATDPSQQLGVEWGRSPGGAQMTVWDRGPGFVGDPSALFAPWYTTKERGTGLGLAITHRLVRAHGWSIEASRELGRTLFTITIQDADVVQSKKPAARQDPGEVA
jgi:signal transduction histidine kinase